MIRHERPWKGLDDVELATLEPLDYVPPAEIEETYCALSAAKQREEGLKEESLH